MSVSVFIPVSKHVLSAQLSSLSLEPVFGLLAVQTLLSLKSCYNPPHPFGLCHSPTVSSEQFHKKCGSAPVFLILDTEPSLLPGVPGPLLPSPVSRAVTPDLSLPCVSHPSPASPRLSKSNPASWAWGRATSCRKPGAAVGCSEAVTRESRASPSNSGDAGPCSAECSLCSASRPSSLLPTGAPSVLSFVTFRRGQAELRAHPLSQALILLVSEQGSEDTLACLPETVFITPVIRSTDACSSDLRSWCWSGPALQLPLEMPQGQSHSLLRRPEVHPLCLCKMLCERHLSQVEATLQGYMNKMSRKHKRPSLLSLVQIFPRPKPGRPTGPGYISDAAQRRRRRAHPLCCGLWVISSKASVRTAKPQNTR
ncbi:uncharacterized protein LOC111160392 [Enhydra lutris kenyoni]|uniref:Uncharacterized protein LOC111160392 n=1 Tax=Enhydra lutris kenyoni TaxID=391180 RepID=A0A2Y9L6F5_ENHLU|nr:uncharacterized protein LOC111160392 [Enhydra lutris kenyoni]